MGYLFLIVFSLFLFLLTYFAYSSHKTKVMFESKGIPYVGNGSIRLLINSLKGIGLVDELINSYNKSKTKGQLLVGAVDFGMTTLIVMDPELVKSIFVKDFDHFPDRRKFPSPKDDVIFGKMLFSVSGDHWRALRSKLSPTFTTGKIKRLFKLFDQSGKKFVHFVDSEMRQSASGEIDITDGFSKFTMDIIASAACGIDSKAFDQREPSCFEQMGQKMQIQFGRLKLIKLVIMLSSKTVTDLFGLTFFGKDVVEFFSRAIKASIHHRQVLNEKRDDFIQLMLEAREGLLKTEDGELEAFEKDAVLKTQESQEKVSADILDDDGIVANAILFMLAGFDTMQSLLLFCAYSLAINQDCQEKLRKEVNEAFEENNGDITYEELNKMTYMDMVINETLRMYPAAPVIDRGCITDYKVPGTDFTLKAGGGIVVPIYAIHHDPDYFPNPTKFDPERFSPENKGNIKPYAFMPFGHGPRNCIGMRFALAEVKVAISHLVHNFRIEPSKNTLIPMKFSKTNSLKPEGGMFLSFNKIEH